MIDTIRLLELDKLAKDEGKKYAKKRNVYTSLIKKTKHFIGIVGPRGVGKTILLKQIALSMQESFYLSADTLENEDLFEIAKTLKERYKIKCLLIDEIHFQQDFDKKLKQIFDFLDIRIIFTSSVALSIVESSYDLSRRVELIHVNPFSFREFLLFKYDRDLPALTFGDLIEKNWTVEHLKTELYFDEYLRGGLMPFALEEGDILPLLSNILQKIIQRDIPHVAKLGISELPLIEKMVRFIGKSAIEGINYSSLSHNIGITKYKAESYMSLLKNAFVLHPVFPKGTNVLREPKVLMFLPYRLLYRDFSEAVGGLREDFFAQEMFFHHKNFFYLKSNRGEKTPDYLIQDDNEDIVIEIGGKSKGRSQFKGIDIEKKIILTHRGVSDDIKRPLFLLGFIR